MGLRRTCLNWTARLESNELKTKRRLTERGSQAGLYIGHATELVFLKMDAIDWTAKTSRMSGTKCDPNQVV